MRLGLARGRYAMTGKPTWDIKVSKQKIFSTLGLYVWWTLMLLYLLATKPDKGSNVHDFFLMLFAPLPLLAAYCILSVVFAYLKVSLYSFCRQHYCAEPIYLDDERDHHHVSPRRHRL
jgi:hypothetical protein